MKYYTATEAAARLGVSTKTIQNWLHQGKLTAHRPAHNRLAIDAAQVERLARDREQYVELPDVATLHEAMQALQQRVDDLEQQLATMRRTETPARPSGEEKLSLSSSQNVNHQNRVVARNRASKEELPPGCILARDFALQHGVSPATFRDHITIGIGRGEEKDKVAASERPKANRPGETERYLTSDQQQAALDYWTRHGVPHH